MLEKEYCNYFSFQQATKELLDAHLMREESMRNYVRYIITREGEDTLEFFGENLPSNIREDMDAFLSDNLIKLRNEVGVSAGYQESQEGDYLVELEIREGVEPLIKLGVSVPTEEQAKIMCDNWNESNQRVYELVMKELLKD